MLSGPRRYTCWVGFPMTLEFPQRHWNYTIYPLDKDGKIVMCTDSRGRTYHVKTYLSKSIYPTEDAARAAGEAHIVRIGDR